MSRDRALLTGLVLATVGMGISAPPASAQTVQKCVAQDGTVMFTSGECTAGQRAEARYDAVPDQPDDAAAKRLADLEQWAQSHAERKSTSGRTYRPPRSRSTGTSKHARCEAAKRKRDAQLERLGLRRTHADLRRLDEPVREACR